MFIFVCVVDGAKVQKKSRICKFLWDFCDKNAFFVILIFANLRCLFVGKLFVWGLFCELDCENKKKKGAFFFAKREITITKTSPSGHPACGLERCQLDTCNTKKKRQSRVRIQFLAARATIISDETDEERTCLLGGGAGRSFNRLSYRGIDRAKGVI